MTTLSVVFRRIHIVAAAVFSLSIIPAVASAQSAQNVILVHGAWGDGANWSKVIPILAAKGLNVTAVQLPLTSLADDAATVKRAIGLVDGPVVLAGHSYGGAVITEAGNDPKVSALVYVAAFAPDAGQSAGSLNATVAPSPMAAEAKPDAEGFIKLTKTGVYDDFAQDVTPAEKQLLYVTESPTSVKSLGGSITDAAWHNKPSWYIVASHDRAIQPALEAEMAKAIKAKTTTVEGSHLIMLSKASAVAAVIEQATH
ncbi:alpha/beta hydrolase [Mesorhizobium sp. B2-4-12]|uniref:alpha/beta fold hydrolase n=1 Tax=unclassified Mesorhizobium TaxID=325217 RepID=UPI001129B32B|nr:MULTISPECIES: alpha/beta hydrolase [unclassified Mesorhizobium]TPK90223.1 alpha/beta hydrolase [Mesorhizobium sp. B2-4-17]TPK91216.1 alpha/beta hydrolase [Mesorhizobium sp. B2-4-12]